MTSLSPPPKPPTPHGSCGLTLAAFVALITAVVLGLRSLL